MPRRVASKGIPFDAAAAAPAIDAPARRRLPPLLRRCWFNLNQAFRRRITHTGITPDQFTVMRTLAECGARGLTQRELSDLMSSDPNTIASLLERMESGGLIKRAPDAQDRRARRLRLRPAGRRKFDEVRVIAAALQAEALSVLPDSAREDFLEHLALVADACHAASRNRSARP
jgi:DNA-binding MarR family transcriptional regulator